jgi:hypothetical protein
MKVYNGSSWDIIAPDTSNFVDKSLWSAKGVLVSATTSSVPTALTPASTNGFILSVDSSEATGLKWIANDQGDITEITAGVGISISDGSGPIPTVTNTVATTFDSKGDLIVGTGADTFEKVSLGTNGQFLQANSATTSGVQWAAVATDPITDIFLLMGA